MSKHNFNFSEVSAVSEVPKAVEVVVSTYQSSEDGPIIHESIPVDIHRYLDEENFSVQHGSVFYVMLHVKADDKSIAKKVTTAIAGLPKHLTKVSVLADVGCLKQFTAALLVATAQHWTAKSEQKAKQPKDVTIVYEGDEPLSELNDQIQLGKALALAQATKIRLIEMPSNYLTPTALLQEAKNIMASSQKVTLSVVSGKDLEEEGYGSLYAVSKGSVEEGHLITLEYNGGVKGEAPIVLVGKGLTFDSGGISIKPSRGMGRMKGDMGGAATVLASLIYAIETNVKKNIVAIIATCENMPDAAALKPGDVITAKNGKTIEVEDTDAEGRLVLADALCHAQTFNGAVTIDFATLTGAVIAAIGHVHTGLFTESDEWAETLLAAGKASGDTAWRLPMGDEYNHFLESSVADLNNLCLGQGAGATNGAIFLREFAPKENWVHLDIAGTSDHNGGTGRPVGLMSHFLDTFR
jgi:leucyl aminopeptidase